MKFLIGEVAMVTSLGNGDQREWLVLSLEKLCLAGPCMSGAPQAATK
jgi:hypothetical protein